VKYILRLKKLIEKNNWDIFFKNQKEKSNPLKKNIFTATNKIKCLIFKGLLFA
jgi:hypothetical protein